MLYSFLASIIFIAVFFSRSASKEPKLRHCVLLLGKVSIAHNDQHIGDQYQYNT